jgi:hypothetical protein
VTARGPKEFGYRKTTASNVSSGLPSSAALCRALHAVLWAVPDVAFEFGPPELHPESRKLRRVIRAFDNPDAV